VLGRNFFFWRLGDLKGVRVLEFGGDQMRGNGGNLGKGVEGGGGRSKACLLVTFREWDSVDGRGSVREWGLSARREYKVPQGYPCAGGVGGSGCEGVFLVVIDSTGEVFLGVLGEVFDSKIVGKGEQGGMCNTYTQREPSISVVVSDAGAAKVVKERGHLGYTVVSYD
jgi:hypothetical protein